MSLAMLENTEGELNYLDVTCNKAVKLLFFESG